MSRKDDLKQLKFELGELLKDYAKYLEAMVISDGDEKLVVDAKVLVDLDKVADELNATTKKFTKEASDIDFAETKDDELTESTRTKQINHWL